MKFHSPKITIAAGCAHTLGLRSDGTVVAVGDNEYGQCNVSDWRVKKDSRYNIETMNKELVSIAEELRSIKSIGIYKTRGTSGHLKGALADEESE